MRRFKLVSMALGGCLVVGTLVGANRLTNGSGGTPPGAAGNPPPAAKPDGLVAKGRVVTEFDLIPVHLPAHLSAGRVQTIHVKNAQAVKKGDALVKFDDWNLQRDLQAAQAQVQVALHKHQEALKGVEHQKLLDEKADLAVASSEQMLARAKQVQDATRRALEIQFNTIPPENRRTLDQYLRENVDYLRAEGAVEAADSQVKRDRIAKREVALSPAADLVNQAVATVNTAQAAVEKAKDAIAQTELKADVPGTIERLAASPGQVVYPQSPALFYLIPDGTRFVTAEIAPDFAYKLRDKDGGKVIISDDSNPGLTYDGTVEQVGTAFLPKSGGIDLLNGKATYVLEVRVRVTDPAPAGKPPLRVNQPVRVTFP